MKKLIIYAVIACLAMAACTKNEVAVTEGTSDQLIAFSSPVVGVPTKVEVGYPISNPNFHVLGRIHTGDYDGWNNSTRYMDTDVAHITYIVAETEYHTWAPTPYPYYWPKNDDSMLSFLAYSPAGVKDASIGETGVKFDNYEVSPVDPLDLTEHYVDLLYSDMTYNQTHSNVTGSPEYSAVAPKYQGVNLHFKHALSSINFEVKTVTDFSETAEIKLKSITLSSINKKGSFDQKLFTSAVVYVSGPLEQLTPLPAWTLADPAVQESYTALDVDIPVTKVAASVGRELILLPQPLKKDVQKVTIIYTTQTKIDGSLSGPVVTNIADVYFYKDEGDNKWEIGKKYVYTISIGLKKIFFSPSVYDWTSGSSPTIEI